MREIRLYFIAAPNRIKIGVTVDVQRRLTEIAKHLDHSIELLGHVSGSYGLEKHLHLLLADHALGREWFKDCPPVRAVVDGALVGEQFNFVAKQKPDSILLEPKEQTYEEWLVMFNKFVAMVFPGDPAGLLAQEFELPREEAAEYLTGKKIVPQILASAFASRFIEWMMAEHLRESATRKSVHGHSRRAF